MATSIIKSYPINTAAGGDKVKAGFDKVNNETTLVYEWLTKIIKNSSGASAPSTTFPGMLWCDTTNGVLKIRNTTDSAWITVGALDTANLGLAPATAGILDTTYLIDEGFVLGGLVSTKNGGIANQLDITAGHAIVYSVGDSTWKEIGVSATNKTTSVASTTYYLDLEPDGTLSWDVNHSSDSYYIPIAQVTTDSSGDISVVSDMRETSFRFAQPGIKVSGSEVWNNTNVSSTISQTGEFTLPNGLVFKWGRTTTTVSSNRGYNTVTFDTAFPTGAFVVLTAPAQLSDGCCFSCGYDLTTTGFKLVTHNDHDDYVHISVHWLAIGY